MEAIDALFDRLKSVSEEVNVNAVFGTPETVEGKTLIPVAEIMYGFGGGAGTGPAGGSSCEGECGEDCDCDEECDCDGECDEDCDCECHEHAGDEAAMGAGGGAGARARPIAYIEVGPEGTRVQSIVDEQKVALAGIALAFWAVGWIGLVLKTLFTRQS